MFLGFRENMSNTNNQETAVFNLKQKANKYLSQGKLDESYATCYEALDILPNSGEIYKILGNIWQRRGQLESARKSYKQAIQYNPNSAEVYANLGSIYAMQKQWEQAIKYYEKAISIKSDFAGFYRNLAKIWQCLGKEQLVTECRYQALILEPTSVSGAEYLSLGDKLLELGKVPEGITCYYMAIKLDKKLSVAYDKLANILIQQGELDEAIKVYSQAIELMPKKTGLYYKLGELLTKNQDYKQAINAYNQAIELNPNNHIFYMKLGEVLQKQGLLEDGMSCLIQALQIKPSAWNVYFKITEFLELQNNLNAANACRLYQKLPKDLLKKCCQLTGDYELTSDSINRINKINIYPPSKIDLLPSQNIEKKLHPSFQMNRVKSGEAFVAIVPEARAWGDLLNSVIITADNKLVRDISSGNGELIISSSKLSPVQKLKGTVAFLSVKFGGACYYHWMFDIISRIFLVYQSGIDISSIDKFVVNKFQTMFQKETIRYLGIPENKIVESSNCPYIQADQLIVPSIPVNDGFRTTQWGCASLKSIFLSNQVSRPLFYPERIYISRNQASRRRIVNEEEVVNLLKKIGFQIITFESTSIREQALYLANAQIVVGPHGAGLTNILFCNPGTKIIEFFAPEYIVVCYWVISNICGLQYYHSIGDKFDNDFSGQPVEKDILVNLEKLLYLIKIAKII